MNPPDVSVIVVTRDRAKLVDQALAALASQQWTGGTWDIVVVDNGSTDATATTLQRWAAQMPVALKVVRADGGAGPAYARNVGVAQTTAARLLFADDDDQVGSGWLPAMVAALDRQQLITPRFDYTRLNEPAVAESATAFTTQLPEIGGVPVTGAGGFGCCRSLWDHLEGMNESMRYGEDIDFSLRASEAGVDPVFVPDALYHVRLRAGFTAAFGRGRNLGQAGVHVYLRHGRARGHQPDRIGLLVRVWAGYAIRIPSLMSRGHRLVYAEQLGTRVGRLTASFRHRVWYP